MPATNICAQHDEWGATLEAPFWLFEPDSGAIDAVEDADGVVEDADEAG